LPEKIIRLQSIDSTHKFAIRLVENGKAVECAIVAENQTAGIGRCGRKWESLHGNLFTSIVKKFPQNYDNGKLSLMVACAVHEAISFYIPGDLYLHWPNDIFYKKLKLAGILIAVVDCWTIISVGVNVSSAPEIGVAVSLKDVCGSGIVSAEEMLNNILVKLNKWLCAFEKFGFLCVKSYWLQYINEINCKVIVRNGSDSISGIVRGIDDFGRLILNRDDQNLLISSGDMFLNMERIVINYE
jgi:BirA family biotin operon repressor/biotin-[acetyl-CoA-carboxylase] ligase